MKHSIAEKRCTVSGVHPGKGMNFYCTLNNYYFIAVNQKSKLYISTQLLLLPQ